MLTCLSAQLSVQNQDLIEKNLTLQEHLRLIASPIPATQFSGCTTGAPSQADVDHPEPQEVLVSKEACLQFGK